MISTYLLTAAIAGVAGGLVATGAGAPSRPPQAAAADHLGVTTRHEIRLGVGGLADVRYAAAGRVGQTLADTTNAERIVTDGGLWVVVVLVRAAPAGEVTCRISVDGVVVVERHAANGELTACVWSG